MAKQTELELTAQQAAQPEETPAKKTAAKKTAAKKPAAKKATTKKTTTKTKAAKAEDGETAAEKPAAKRTTKKTEAKPGTKLVIVESPAKAKTIGKYLGRGYTVTASMGHIRDLPASTLGIDVEHGYTPKYITIKGKTALVKDLKAEAKKAQTVYLATDPDREGEAISWHLANVLGLDPTAPNRVTFDEITKKGVQEGMAHPRTIDMDLFNAQQARRALDRLVGYKLSPFLWHKVRRGLSAGRVQSVAVRIIRDREIEIENFKPEEYWNIDANLKPRQSGCAFNARLTAQADGTKLVVKNKKQADAILAALDGKPYTVTRVDKGQRRRQPQPPFITSTLQQDASRALGFSATRTMRAAQRLYEGMEVHGYGQIGLITYMRTDSLRIADEAAAAAKTFIGKTWGENYVCNKKRVWKSRSATAAQDAHEAIRPSMPELTPDQVEGSISGDEAKLYRLIWSRFVACQMADAILDTVSADIVCEGQVFRASGHTVAFPGFTAVYEEGTDDEKKQDSAGKPLPRFDQGDKLTAEKIEPSQHFTQPPARYTEASLIRAMEERGIGRPSTYAPTISTIIDRDYVTKENKALRPTPLGEGVTGLLVDEFKSVADYEFTANMEHELDEVEAGKLNYIQLLHNFYDGFEAALKQAEIDLEGKRIKIQDEVTDVICEKCGRNMVIKSGRFGKFLACPGFPECTNTKPITEDTGAACPVCGAKVVKKKSARGYVYYSCDTYPTCQFMTWDKPLKTKCPNCDSSLFRHTDRDSKEVTDVCLREGCGYKELVKEGLPPEETEKRRKMRQARAAKAAERAAAKEAAETEEKVKKATKKAAVKKSTAKKTLPWMTKTTNKFKKLKDEAVQELTAKQQEQYAKALAKYEAEKAAEKAKKAAEKKAAAKKPAAKKKTTAKESAE